jgi:hypothetical protein
LREFLDYQAAAKKLNFTTIPFSKVKVIRYTRKDLVVTVEYGLSFDQNPLTPADYNKGKKVLCESKTTSQVRYDACHFQFSQRCVQKQPCHHIK